MAFCYDTDSKRYEYCQSQFSTYVAVGVIIPLAILLIIGLACVYLRCRRRQLRRQEQQTYMATIIPIYNNDEQQQVPYNYTYPPHYTSLSEDAFDKPPSYEQTVQEVSETNNNNLVDPPAILPVTTISEGRVESTRH